jgi:hypothetical protein
MGAGPLTPERAGDFILAISFQPAGRTHKMRNSLLSAVAAATLLMAASPVIAKGGTWVPVSLPNSESTTVFGINDSNNISGQYTDSSGNVHGFISDFAGDNVTNIDDPDGDTQARGMNDKNYVTGFDAGAFAPWEYSSKGKLSPITKGKTDLDQLIQGITKAGVFTGDYTNTSTNLVVGYLGEKAKWTSDITLKINNLGYAGRAIDTAGDMAGWYYDPTTGLQRGWLLMSGAKKPTLLDYPNAQYTVVEGMNDKGLVTGQWEDTSGTIHGFIYTISTKKFVDLDAAGATLTQVWNINNNNVIAVSASTGSFVYCMTKKGCPGTAAHVSIPPVKYIAARP